MQVHHTHLLFLAFIICQRTVSTKHRFFAGCKYRVFNLDEQTLIFTQKNSSCTTLLFGSSNKKYSVFSSCQIHSVTYQFLLKRTILSCFNICKSLPLSCYQSVSVLNVLWSWYFQQMFTKFKDIFKCLAYKTGGVSSNCCIKVFFMFSSDFVSHPSVPAKYPCQTCLPFRSKLYISHRLFDIPEAAASTLICPLSP